MKTSIMAIALLLFSEAALCSSWTIISADRQSAWFIDPTTISDEGQDIKGFWVATVNVDKAVPFDTAVIYEQVKCHKRQIRDLQHSFYLRGEPKGSRAVTSPWEHVIPETISEGLLLFACQKYDSKDFTYPNTPAMNLWKVVQPVLRRLK